MNYKPRFPMYQTHCLNGHIDKIFTHVFFVWTTIPLYLSVGKSFPKKIIWFLFLETTIMVSIDSSTLYKHQSNCLHISTMKRAESRLLFEAQIFWSTCVALGRGCRMSKITPKNKGRHCKTFTTPALPGLFSNFLKGHKENWGVYTRAVTHPWKSGAVFGPG